MFAFLPTITESLLGVDPAAFGPNDIIRLVLALITFLIAAGAALFFVMLVIGGYQYIFSFGNEEMTKKGKDTLVWALLGFALTVAAYTIIRVVALYIANPETFRTLF